MNSILLLQYYTALKQSLCLLNHFREIIARVHRAQLFACQSWPINLMSWIINLLSKKSKWNSEANTLMHPWKNWWFSIIATFKKKADNIECFIYRVLFKSQNIRQHYLTNNVIIFSKITTSKLCLITRSAITEKLN